MIYIIFIKEISDLEDLLNVFPLCVCLITWAQHPQKTAQEGKDK